MLTPDVIRLLPLIVASLLTRLYLAYAIPVIAMDGMLYVSVAKDLMAGNWAKAMTVGSHPLYPFSVMIAHLRVDDWQWAGQLVSVLFGSISVIPMYYLSRRLFDEKVALISSILFILHPLHARASAEVVTEATFIFFFLIALLYAWKSLAKDDLWAVFVAGLFSAFAFLSRPEGLVILLVTSVWLAFVKPRRRVVALNLLGLPFLLIAGSYLIYLRQHTGVWMVTPKKSVLVLLGLAEKPGIASKLFQLQSAKRITDLPAGLGWVNFFWHDFVYELIQTYHPLLLILVISGLFVVFIQTGLRREELFIGSVSVAYLVPLTGLFLTYGYVTHRHFLPIVLITLPWAGHGLVSWVERASQKLENRLGHPVDQRKLVSCVVATVVIILALKTLQPRRWDKLPVKEAGLWIKAQRTGSARIVTSEPRIAFYADASWIVVEDSLSNRNSSDQEAILLRLLEKARFERAQYIFLPGQPTSDLATKIAEIPATGSVKIWKSSWGNSYTLITIGTDHGERHLRRHPTAAATVFTEVIADGLQG